MKCGLGWAPGRSAARVRNTGICGVLVAQPRKEEALIAHSSTLSWRWCLESERGPPPDDVTQEHPRPPRTTAPHMRFALICSTDLDGLCLLVHHKPPQLWYPTSCRGYIPAFGHRVCLALFPVSSALAQSGPHCDRLPAGPNITHIHALLSSALPKILQRDDPRLVSHSSPTSAGLLFLACCIGLSRISTASTHHPPSPLLNTPITRNAHSGEKAGQGWHY